MELFYNFLPLIIIAGVVILVVRWVRSVRYLKHGAEKSLKKAGIKPVKPSGKKANKAEATGWKAMSRYTEKVVGVTQRDDDGTSRQKIIRKLREGDAIDLVRDPDNEHDPNAIKVYRKHHQIGFIESGRASELAPQMDKGYRVEVEVEKILGGGSGKSYGVVIAIQRYKPQN